VDARRVKPIRAFNFGKRDCQRTGPAQQLPVGLAEPRSLFVQQQWQAETARGQRRGKARIAAKSDHQLHLAALEINPRAPHRPHNGQRRARLLEKTAFEMAGRQYDVVNPGQRVRVTCAPAFGMNDHTIPACDEFPRQRFSRKQVPASASGSEGDGEGCRRQGGRISGFHAISINDRYHCPCPSVDHTEP